MGRLIYFVSYPLPFQDRFAKSEPKPAFCDTEIPKHHRHYVCWVLSGFTWSKLTTYWREGLATGKGTESRYKERHVEATLVMDLNGAYGTVLDDFRSAVNDRVSARYSWFQPSSLHMTVRNIVLESTSS